MKTKIIWTFIIICVGYTQSFGQCYARFRQEGLNAYNGANYSNAIQLFTKAKNCSDKPSGHDLDAWISKSQQAVNYYNYKQQGINYYNQANYESASYYFDLALNTGFSASNDNIYDYKNKCDRAKKQADYQSYKSTAFSYYNKGDYANALYYFKYARDTGYPAYNDEVYTYITRCEAKIAEAKNVYKTIFYDDFSSDTRSWTSAKSNNVETQVVNGDLQLIYHYEYEKTNYIATECRYISLNENKDFVIEMRLGPSSSYKKNYGIIWARKDWDNYYQFKIYPDGYYEIIKEKTGSVTTLKSKTSSSAINQGGKYNTLKISKSGSTVYFYINDTSVGSIPHESFYGYYMGPYIGNGGTIFVDSWKVSGYEK